MNSQRMSFLFLFTILATVLSSYASECLSFPAIPLRGKDIGSSSSSSSSSLTPPEGGLYSHSVKLPILGQSEVTMKFYSDSLGHLIVDGILPIDEKVPYSANPDGSFAVRLSPETKKNLGRILVQIKTAGYDATKDETYVVMTIASVFRKRLRLTRKYTE